MQILDKILSGLSVGRKLLERIADKTVHHEQENKSYVDLRPNSVGRRML